MFYSEVEPGAGSQRYVTFSVPGSGGATAPHQYIHPTPTSVTDPTSFVVETSVAGGSRFFIDGNEVWSDTNFGWDAIGYVAFTSYRTFADSITLEVVPEPSTIGLLSAAF